MGNQQSYATALASWIGRALADGARLFDPFSGEALGITLPDIVLQSPAVGSALTVAKVAATDIAAAAMNLEAQLNPTSLLALGDALTHYYDSIDDLSTTVLNACVLIADATSRADAEAFASDLAKKVSDFAIASSIIKGYPRLAFLLTLTGIFDWQYMPPQAGQNLSSHHIRKQLHLDRIKDLIDDPKSHLLQSIGWGSTGFDPTRFFTLAAEFFPIEAAVTTGLQAGEPFIEVGDLTLNRNSSLSPPGLLLSLMAEIESDAGTRRDVSDRWSVGFTSTLRMTGEVSGTLTPPLTFRLQPLAGAIDGALRLYVERTEAARPVPIIGGTGLLTVAAENLTAGVGLTADWDAGSNAATFEPTVFASLDGGTLKIEKGDADSFVGSLLPSKGIEGEFDLGLEWKASSGLRFHGSGGIDIALPVHKQLGPLKIETIYIALRIRDDGTLSLEISAEIGAKIGPVAVAVDRVGAFLDICFADGVDAHYGPFDLDLRFKPPSGLGVVIQAGPVTGGGFISYDEAAGRYSGVLQLQIRDIAIKAIGILDTKLPGGGYSFLIIISAEFSPIQLGLGFTLNGVGGLAGINRTVTIAAMQAGIRNHAADGVLFPKDPVANAPRIISDLQRFFPPLKEHYIFGPAALIGWGTPTLLTVKLGIILEFPPPLRIVLLGQLDCALPDASTAIVDLHVDVLGVIDFGAKTFALDGIIHDSRVGPYALYGDFAVRLRWGSDPTFALSIGGFNPHFHQIPAGFPSLRRITIALSDGANPRLTLQCYLALTSNSLQLGARAELYAESDGFSVSGWIGFDALVYFHPFGFRVDLSAGFALRRGKRSLGGIQVDATLTGPSPWHVWGDASISVLCFDVSVSFDVTIGSGGPGALPSREIWPALWGAIQTGENWSAVLPPAAAQVVTLRQPFDSTPSPNAPGLLIDPVGTITLVERTAPLDRTITRFADASPSGTHRFDLDQVTINAKPINGWTLTQELFAPALFEQLSDEQKLSRASFERMAAGMSLPQLVTLGGFAASNVTFRTVVFDSPAESHDGVSYAMDAALQVALADVGSAATGGIRVSTQPYIAPGTKPKVTLDEETYVIVWAADLTRRLTSQGPKGAVIAALNDYLATHPADRLNLIVVPEYEAAA